MNRDIPTKYYIKGTVSFIKKHLREVDDKFATVEQVLSHHANYLWYNIVLHNTYDFPFSKWTKYTRNKRLKHLINVIGVNPIFSIEFGNFGWKNLELLNTKSPKVGRALKPTYRIELVMLYLFMAGQLKNKSINDIREILQEISGKRINKNMCHKLMKNYFLIKDDMIYGIQSNKFKI